MGTSQTLGFSLATTFHMHPVLFFSGTSQHPGLSSAHFPPEATSTDSLSPSDPSLSSGPLRRIPIPPDRNKSFRHHHFQPVLQYRSDHLPLLFHSFISTPIFPAHNFFCTAGSLKPHFYPLADKTACFEELPFTMFNPNILAF